MQPLKAANYGFSCLPILAGIVLLAAPGYSQYYSNDITPPSANSGKLQGASSGKQVGGGSNSHAYVLSGNALSAVDLHPATGYYSSMATSTDGTDQCGYSGSNLGGYHAMKWSGSSSSAVDLHPSGYNFSYCTSVDNGQQGGFAEQQSYFIAASHAMLWNGSPVAIDLHPLAYTFSRVMGIKSGQQVGYGSTVVYTYGDYPGVHGTSQALLWNGTAASYVILHPSASFTASEALATNGTQQGGWGYNVTNGGRHGLLWSGTSTSAIDLHPAGYTDSSVTALTATMQVGEGWVGVPGTAGSVRHALLWSGSASSVVDLNQYLPAGYVHAVATGIDANGNAVGYAYNTFSYGLAISPDAIAVVFAPGQAPAGSLSSITLSTTSPAPDSTVQATISLSSAAPAVGVTLTFLSTNLAMMATPASVTILQGQTSITVSIPVLGSTLIVPTAAKLFVSDGNASRNVFFTVTPVVKIASVTANPVEGGLSTVGTAVLNIPAQVGTVVSLTSSNPALLQVPATISAYQGQMSVQFSATTSVVTAITSVPVTATVNGTSATASFTLNPGPVISLSSITGPSVVGGQSINGYVVLNNYARGAAGATVTLSSTDSAVQLPATVVVPYGTTVGYFTGTSSAVPTTKSVSIRASYNGSQVTGTVTLAQLPTVTIILADYKPLTQLLKIDATTSYANSTLTFGSNGVAFGTMQLNNTGVGYAGSILMATPPATVTVWNSNGGQATAPVTISISGGGGGGGGGTATGPFKITTSKTGKGTITANPSAATYASGTVVVLTATPDPGQPWIGWGGACSGTATTCTLTMTSDKAVSANFK